MNIKPFKEVYTEVDSITLLLTNDCNLRCDYCFEVNKGKEYILKETAEKIIKSTFRKLPSKIYNHNKFTVNFFGGEPMLAWDVIKHVCDFKNKENMDMFLGLTTNMTIMTDEMLDYIDDNDIFLLVSVDGTKEAHNAHRCGSFDTAIKNLNKVINRGLGHLVEIRMTVTPDTAKYMAESVKMFIDMGLNNICPVPASDLNWTDDDINDLRDSFNKTLLMYIDILNDKNNKRNINIRKIDDALNNVLAPTSDYKRMCNIANYHWVIVDWKGDIFPCPDFPTTDNKSLLDLKIGNFFTGVDVDKIRKEPMIATFEKPECEGCEAKYSCKSGCPYQNFYQNGSFYRASDSYCKIERMFCTEIKKFRDDLMKASNIRSRSLNVLVENLKLKDYFDNVIKKSSPLDREFIFKVKHFNELLKNIEESDILLPSFKDYFILDLGKIFAIMSALTGKKINLPKKDGD